MDKIYPGKQLENEFKIRKKKRYLPIGQEYPVWSIACISYNDAKNLERFFEPRENKSDMGHGRQHGCF